MKTTVQAEVDFPWLVRTHHAMVWRYLRLLGCESALAEDLAQETFLTVYRRPPADLPVRAAAAYLRRVARSRFVDAMRKLDRTVPLDLEEAEKVWLDTMDDSSELRWHEALDDCLQLLESRPREVLDLRYRDQLPIRKVARVMGMKESGVKTMLGRVKQRLRECIERKVKTSD